MFPQAIARQSRVLAGCRCCCAMLALLISTAAAFAQARPSPLDVVIRPTHWPEVRERLRLSADQQPIADSLFETYSEQIALLEIETDRAVDLAGRARVEEIRQRLRDAMEELKQKQGGTFESDREYLDGIRRECDAEAQPYQLDIVKAALVGKKKADQLLAQFFADLQAAIPSLPPSTIQAAECLILRLSLLPASGDERREFAIPNPLQLLEEASRPGAELVDIQSASADPKIVELRASIDQAIEEYESRLHAVLQRFLAIFRRPPTPASIAPIYHDAPTPDQEKILKERIRITADRLDLSITAHASIDALLRQAGYTAEADRLQTRYQTMMCYSLFEPKWPHGMVDWLAKRSDSTPEQQAAAKELLAQFNHEHPPARSKVLEAGILTLKSSPNLHGLDREQLAFAKAVFDYEDCIANTMQRFRSLLISSQIADYDRQVDELRIRNDLAIRGPALIYRSKARQALGR